MGSYWRYGRSVVQLGRRLLPPLYSEDYNTDFKDKGYVSLVRSVLDFTVTLGNAANQASSSEDLHGFVAECLVAPSKKLQALRAKAANGETTSFSWFQSPTADEDHSYMFLSDNKQPSRCSPYCQWQNISFPVQFHFRSRHAKDVAMYDDKEKPVLILPNLAFKVVRGDHRPLLCHVHSRAGEVAQRDAPLPQLAIQEGRAKLWPIPPPSAGSARSQDGQDPWMCSEGLRYRSLCNVD